MKRAFSWPRGSWGVRRLVKEGGSWQAQARPRRAFTGATLCCPHRSPGLGNHRDTVPASVEASAGGHARLGAITGRSCVLAAALPICGENS